MPEPYPIVESRTLNPVGRSGLLGLGARKREWQDRPPPKADQAQVYLVDGRHVVDHGRLGPEDDTIVRAAHVSVVDLTTNRGVPVELSIPSADAKQFTVRVNFLCTVLEPDKIVKFGQGDAQAVLLGYLRKYQKLFQLGLDYKISAINDVRLLVQSQLESYNMHVPPDTPGMRVVLASTEVLTPDELVAIHDSRFQNEQGHITATAKARYELELDQITASHAEQLELQKKSYELKLAEQEHNLNMAHQLGQQQWTEGANRFATAQAEQLNNAIGDDPWKAAYVALQGGEGSMGQIAEGLRAVRADAEARHRELEDRQYGHEREERIRVFASRLDVVKELAKHGHLDEVSIDEIDHFMDRLVGRVAKTELNAPAAPRPELDEGDEPFSEDED